MNAPQRSVPLIALLVPPAVVWLSAFAPQPVEQVVGHYAPPAWPEATEDDRELNRENTRFLLLNPCDEQVADGANEVHDCQRLIRRGAGGQMEFGPLVGIIPDLDAVEQREDYFREARVVARISNAGSLNGSHSYPPLNISGPTESGRVSGHCLWLGVQGSEWRAAIRPTVVREASARVETREDPTACGEPPRELDLAVHRRTRREPDEAGRETDAPIERYPNTARWGWSTASSEHYIGVKCGAAWCDIGREGFQPVEIPAWTEEVDARRAIPGWHDGQFLAVPDTIDNRVILRPGPWAMVYPLQLTNSSWTGFRATARVEFSGDPGAYRNKFRIPEDAPRLYSTILMGTEGGEPRVMYRSSKGDVGGTRNVVPGSDGTNHAPHGAVRFRWRIGDETIWVPCSRYGCCDIDPDAGG